MLKRNRTTIILLVFLIVLSLASLFIGVIDIDMDSLMAGGFELEVFLLARIPRLLAILCTGVGMSVSGLIMQQLCMNKFVSPTTGATMQSAQFGICIAMLFFPTMGLWVRTIFAFILSVAGTLAFVFFVQRIQVKDTVLVPLVGIMFGNVISGKNILLAMYNNNTMSIMDTESQLNILARELGGKNLGETVGEVDKATHGEDASWETIIQLNPEYIFVLDRSTATGAADEGVLGAKEVIENDLIKTLDVYKNGNIIYFIRHANVWYTSTGGIQALDTMLADLEAELLN